MNHVCENGTAKIGGSSCKSRWINERFQVSLVIGHLEGSTTPKTCHVGFVATFLSCLT